MHGWDDHFAKCSKNLNSLQARRYSPYYKVILAEVSSWEDKVNRAHALIDI